MIGVTNSIRRKKPSNLRSIARISSNPLSSSNIKNQQADKYNINLLKFTVTKRTQYELTPSEFVSLGLVRCLLMFIYDQGFNADFVVRNRCIALS